jgi:hypothetical protein
MRRHRRGRYRALRHTSRAIHGFDTSLGLPDAPADLTVGLDRVRAVEYLSRPHRDAFGERAAW